MKCKTMVLWWLVNTPKEHPQLEKSDRKIKALMPLVSTLFPGIDCHSVTTFEEAMYTCVIPVIKKQFPELLTAPAESITADAMTEVAEFLPSGKYEWQNSTEWKSKFDALLAAQTS